MTSYVYIYIYIYENFVKNQVHPYYMGYAISVVDRLKITIHVLSLITINYISTCVHAYMRTKYTIAIAIYNGFFTV